MRIVRISPDPQVEIGVSVSEQMEADLKDCYEKSRAREPGNCGGCSWYAIDIEMNKGTSLCGDAELAGKILGKDKEGVKKMKRFVVSLITGTSEFKFECRKISDAYRAIIEASEVLKVDADLDQAMAALVLIDNGDMLSYEKGRIKIEILDADNV